MINELRTAFGPIKAEIKTTYHVNWLSYVGIGPGLEDIFEKAYGKPMEMLESDNDTDYSVELKKEPISKYDQKVIASCIKTGGFENHLLDLLMTDLANKNILPTGSYVVTMSW